MEIDFTFLKTLCMWVLENYQFLLSIILTIFIASKQFKQSKDFTKLHNEVTEANENNLKRVQVSSKEIVANMYWNNWKESKSEVRRIKAVREKGTESDTVESYNLQTEEAEALFWQYHLYLTTQRVIHLNIKDEEDKDQGSLAVKPIGQSCEGSLYTTIGLEKLFYFARIVDVQEVDGVDKDRFNSGDLVALYVQGRQMFVSKYISGSSWLHHLPEDKISVSLSPGPSGGVFFGKPKDELIKEKDCYPII